MTQDTIDQYIAKALGQTATAQEQAHLDAWRKADAQNEKYYRQFEHLWRLGLLAKDTPAFHPDVDRAWQNVHPAVPLQQKSQIPAYAFFTAIASVLLVAMVFLYPYVFPEKVKHIHLVAQNLQEVTLPDGTSVTLRKGATLEYPEAFGEDQRKVNFSGQAYFDVHHDPDHQFIIDMKETQVRVLGTAFNIDEEAHHTVTVSVSRGKVAFETKTKKPQRVVLAKGKQATYQHQQKKISALTAQAPNALAWKTKIFSFNDTPLPEVVKTLNDAYGADIRLESPELFNCSLSMVNHRSQSIESVLATISTILNVEVKQQNNSYRIFGKCQ